MVSHDRSQLKRTFWLLWLVALIAALLPLYAQAPTIQWVRQFGTATDDQAWEVAVDPTGLYVAGITLGALPGQSNAGNYDAFLRKYDVNGNEVWTRQFGTATEDQARALAADVTGVYVGGQTGGTLPGQTSAGGVDAYLRKYDANGNEVWTRQFGTSAFDSASGGVAVDSTGVYIAGYTDGVFPGQSNAGQSAVYVRKYDFTGNELWTRQFGTPTDDNPQGLTADSTGVYVVGSTNGTLSGQSSAGGYDVFARKYDSNGSELWTRQFGTEGTDLPHGLGIDSSGVYVPGWTTGTFSGQSSAGGTDAFVRKYDLNGNELWTRQFGTTGADFAQGAAADSTGIHVVGYVGGTLPGQSSAGGSDLFVRKYDSNGTEIHTLQFGTAGNDLGQDAAVDSTGLYLTGTTGGTFSGQTSAGGNDAFVAKITDGSQQPPPIFLIIDEDSIDNGTKSVEDISFNAPFCGAGSPAVCVNDDIANPSVRVPLFSRPPANAVPPGTTLVLPTGQIGDEGLFRFGNPDPQRSEQNGAMFTTQEFFAASGAAADENNLDKVSNVVPLREADIESLQGRVVCAVVYDSDISSNANPAYGNLKGATLGVTAFRVTSVDPHPNGGSYLPLITVELLAPDTVPAACQSAGSLR